MSDPRRADHLHVVLLAGGGGTRFWPMSRSDRPKQFLKPAGEASLLRATWERALAVSQRARVWAIAPHGLAAAVARELPELHRSRLVIEPSPRDTAAAVALALVSVSRRDPEAIVAVFPTDHWIGRPAAFGAAIRRAARVASAGKLVLLGVPPTRPADTYGYLRLAARSDGASIRVERFVEKPDVARARRLLVSGRYVWNAGIVVGRADLVLEEMALRAPRVLRAAREAQEGRLGAWNRLTPISFDHAVLENTGRLSCVLLRAGWEDLGTWASAARWLGRPGSRRGVVAARRSPGTIVLSDRAVVLLSAPGLLVVDTPDALLIARRDAADGREARNAIASSGRADLL